jgi:hypothetical protein
MRLDNSPIIKDAAAIVITSWAMRPSKFGGFRYRESRCLIFIAEFARIPKGKGVASSW